jgi:hypothetical protein
MADAGRESTTMADAGWLLLATADWLAGCCWLLLTPDDL